MRERKEGRNRKSDSSRLPTGTDCQAKSSLTTHLERSPSFQSLALQQDKGEERDSNQANDHNITNGHKRRIRRQKERKTK